jgi:hypothetical protein
MADCYFLADGADLADVLAIGPFFAHFFGRNSSMIFASTQ